MSRRPPGRGLRLRLCALALVWLAVACHAKPAASQPARRPARLIVRYKQGHGAALVAAAAAGSGGMRPVAPLLNMFALEVEDGSMLEDKAKQLAGMSGVLYAEVDGWASVAPRSRKQPADPAKQLRKLLGQAPPPAAQGLRRPPPPRAPSPPANRQPPPAAFTPRDPFFARQWGLGMIKAPQAWSLTSNASSVRVCIIDTGVMWDHPDLAANLVPETQAHKLANWDDYGHGTHVAGILGAVGNNRRGVAGTALQASLLVCKAFDSQGGGFVSDVVRCIDYCRSKGARVINASFTFGDYYKAMRDAVSAATKAGVFFSSAAGNSGYDTQYSPGYPGSFNLNGSVAVANVGADGKLAPDWYQGENWYPGSNFGKKTVHLAAPGQLILSTYNQKLYNGMYYTVFNGTSMAAPVVSGAAALALAASGGRLTNVQLQQLLMATARRLPALQSKLVSGGVLDLHKLIQAATAAGQAAATIAFS